MFSLEAVIRLQDKASATINKVEANMRKMNRAADASNASISRMEHATSIAGRGFSAMGAAASRSFGSINRGAMGAAGAIAGIGAAYLTAKAGLDLFDKTIGSAARREMSDTTITALFKGDTSKAQKYFDFIDERAAVSFFKQQDFLDTSSAFIPVDKDIEQLKTMTKLAERLGASNKLEGLGGAAFAMRELFSGDSTSLVDRFNLPRTAVNNFKNLPIKEQLKALDMLLDKMGFTEKFLQDQGNTALGQYEQAVDKVNLTLQKMGKQGLEKLTPALVAFNKSLDGPTVQRFAEMGSSAIAKLASGSIKGLSEAKRYLENHFINNPAFQKLTTFDSKVNFAFEEFTKTFKSWYAAGGNKQIADATSSLIGYVSDALSGSSEKLTAIGIDLGKAVASGMLDGIKKFAKDNAELATILTFMATPGPIPIKLAAAGFTLTSSVGNQDSVVKAVEKMNNPAYQQQNYKALNEQGRHLEAGSTWVGDRLKDIVSVPLDPVRDWLEGKSPEKKAGGISRIPYNGFPMIAHKDEMLLTKAEADTRREGRGGGGITLNVNGPINVNGAGSTKEAATEILREIVSQAKGALGGGALANAQ